MLGFLSKLLGGSKSEKDIKKLQPVVKAVNDHFELYRSLSNDELRNKTQEFKARIKEYLVDIDIQIANKKTDAEAIEDLHMREAVLNEVDKLVKTRDEKLEEILEQLLPEAFAVMKETSRRFAEGGSIVSKATELDKTLLESGRTNLSIDGDQVTYNTTWLAAGAEVTWNMVHYDVQLIGGAALHQGKISEMATGEGKTLVSTLATYLNGLAGLGVHLVTVNDYLARRDSEWNGPIFEWLGLRVDCIDKHQPNSESRRNAYNADITYGTNNEFGFDYLRDNMVHRPEEMVQRKHHYAVVDEVDSVLIDDARTPLIISGPVPKGDDQQFQFLKPRIEKIVEAQKRVVNQALNEAKRLIKDGKTDKDAGGLQLYRAFKGMPKNGAIIKLLSEEGNRQIMQKAENYYIAEQQRNMPKVYEELYFYIDEKQNSVDLTEKGLAMITGDGEDPSFFILPDISTALAAIEKSEESEEVKAQNKDLLLQEYAAKADRIHSIQQLLKAYSLFEKDVEYVVIDDKVKIVDEQTGRIMEGRRYSDGLHQAIEAKENVHIEAATQTFATVTLQNYFRMYHKLSGMTGTAETEAGEFWEIYKLDVVNIPTNRGIQRQDHQDLVYKTKREKYKAVIDEVEAMRGIGRPVLVGTTSVEVSELLSRMMQQRKIPHNVLNAKQHAREAQVVTEAGLQGAVTIATNMAGRGTDIKLGAGVKEAGGLAIIGTERHESRRVDRQLRGRAGRQGDPGSSQFFVSLEDELMRLFGSERIASLMDKMGHKEGEVLQHGMITKSIERAQKKVEENNFGIRKRLLEYDDVMNAQRNQIYKRRHNALFGDRVAIDIDNAIYDVASDLIGQYQGGLTHEAFSLEVIKQLAFEPKLSADEAKATNAAELLYEEAKAFYQHKTNAMREIMLPQFIDIKQQNEGRIEYIMIPFSDGIKGMQVQVGLSESIEKEIKPVVESLEKSITLALIDESWKDHLRAMDDLRTSVQMASYEQKDPLLIYKFEAFELFKKMLLETNKSIVSFLFRAGVPAQEEQPQHIQQIPQEYADFEELYDNSREIENRGEDYAANENDYYNEDHVQPKQQPISVEPKIGRNDLCPCGSGKKYKQCHGAN
ncbi:preprotein translocase subunit SecA [Taibaiella sp. KBW10]|uniref:preprotein translocase subunit SecA n=1 Tax=Taibaiella sp. KBW10 TaxID=2153357 RepID=UPI000F59F856|nr:preprotein translocase subunit SecA [Taibaiella sp. KBW10]RQO30680.1 preprotein translocase subunit SecA [Taibaiella sp. KBW10]